MTDRTFGLAIARRILASERLNRDLVTDLTPSSLANWRSIAGVP
jgi:hypothetical protein